MYWHATALQSYTEIIKQIAFDYLLEKPICLIICGRNESHLRLCNVTTATELYENTTMLT